MSIACQFCSQVEGLPRGVQLSTPGRRLGAYLLDAVLAVVTLFVGWLIWSLVIWTNGQSPGKQILGMRVAKVRTGTKATWGTMALREFVGKWLIMGAIGALTFGIASLVLSFMLLWDKNRQQLWDKVAGTVVVDDPGNALMRVNAQSAMLAAPASPPMVPPPPLQP